MIRNHSSLPTNEVSNEYFENFENKDYKKLIKFIDSLSNLDDLNKYWARKDAKEQIMQGKNLDNLKKKYLFYDGAGKIRKDICDLVGDKRKGIQIYDLLEEEILNKKTNEYENRSWKLDKLATIKEEVVCLLKDKNKYLFDSKHKGILGDVETKIMHIMDDKFQKEFQESYEKIFTNNFWSLASKLSPTSFPNFAGAFEFKSPDDLRKEFSTEDLLSFSKELQKSLLADANEIMGQNLFDKTEQDLFVNKFKKSSLTESLQAIIILKKIQQQKNKEKHQLDNKNQSKEQRATKISDKINLLREHGNLKEAKNTLSSLKSLDSKKYNELSKEIDIDITKQDKETPDLSTESKVNLSYEKMWKIKFYERAVEHAEKVKMECSRVGIPEDSPDFWRREGVRGRQSWLREHGKWDKYKEANGSDPNIPSSTASDGFRFRWLNVETGAGLSGAKARKSIEYLDRYKESGYKIATLAGAFSLNWRGSESPVYEPQKFIELITAEKNKLLGVSSSTKPEKIATK